MLVFAATVGGRSGAAPAGAKSAHLRERPLRFAEGPVLASFGNGWPLRFAGSLLIASFGCRRVFLIGSWPPRSPASNLGQFKVPSKDHISQEIKVFIMNGGEVCRYAVYKLIQIGSIWMSLLWMLIS